MRPANRPQWVRALISIEFTLVLLLVLMLLVVICTLDQVNIGTFNAVDKYFRSFFLWATVPGTGFSFPVFPGGGLTGFLLIVNLTASLIWRLRFSRRKLAVMLIHIGMILLVAGEFVTGIFAIESRMPIREGESLNYVVRSRSDELVFVDHSAPDYDEVYSVSDASLRPGRVLSHKGWPFEVRVLSHYPNAAVGRRPAGGNLPPALADQGLGAQVVLQPLGEVSSDDAGNQPAAYLEISAGGKKLGTWLVASALSGEQSFEAGGRKWSLALRPTRRYLDFTLTLKDFRFDRYAGTEIAKNFSSLVRLVDKKRGEDRDALIYMNNPLRHGGRTFYQASFGQNETLSVFQVVENPGWLLPYISVSLMSLGMLLQFFLHLAGFRESRRKES